MAIAKVRDFSKYGVITDVDPYNLPPSAFSMAVNARFIGSSIKRAPVFRRLPLTPSFSDPRYLASNLPVAGFDALYAAYLNGRVTSIVNNAETDVSVFAFVNNSAETPYTSTQLQEVFYINRADRVPWSFGPLDTQFQALSNWDSTWRANLIRNCGGALVALGVTKGANSFPTMVKTSAFALAGAVPVSWDAADPSTNATENTLGDMRGAIKDACPLGTALIIYGLNETWSMIADGSAEVFNYQKLFNDRGAINANCTVELDRKNYVFGPNDIWVHDGVSKQSIVDLKTKEFIFDTINLSKSERCFAIHDPQRKELRFCYSSSDTFAVATGFPPVDGCNRCAVFNLIEGTWTFDDLPYVYGATICNINTIQTYDASSPTYTTVGGSYQDQEDSTKKTLTAFGDANAAASLLESVYAVDNQGPGSTIAYAVDTNATKGVTILRDGIDLDELPEVADNRGYKVVSSIFPQARFEIGAQPLIFNFGSADNYNDPAVFGTAQTYDGHTFDRLDFQIAGRFLSMQITHQDYHYFNLTGIDFLLDVQGQE